MKTNKDRNNKTLHPPNALPPLNKYKENAQKETNHYKNKNKNKIKPNKMKKRKKEKRGV